MHSSLPPSQTTTEPPAPILSLAPLLSGPPSQLVPLDEPQPGPSGLHRPAVLVSVHIEHIEDSFSSSFSYLSALTGYSYYCVYMHMISVSYIPFTWVRWYFSVFSLSTSPRRPERMWTTFRSRRPPKEGPPLPRHPPNLRPNDPD